MLKINNFKTMGSSNLGWLYSHFHFSFAEYYNPLNMNFGVLRVLNDDLVEAHTGFGTHGHKNMEIITYVVNGKLTHNDSMGNERTIGRGDIQYLSAGTGITHSEMNNSDEQVRFLQIWIQPDAKNYAPNYGDYKFDASLREGKWLHMVSSFKNKKAPVNVNQDANIYSLELEKGQTSSFKVETSRQAYLVQIEGSALINTVTLNHGDSLEIIEEEINLQASSKSHFLLLEMEKST